MTAPTMTTPLKLTPLISERVNSFLANKSLLFQLLDGLGSPLNLLFPQNLHQNVEAFHNSFKQNGIIGRVFFAHKCNRSDSLVRQLSVENSNIDVSSLRELQHALSNGFVGSRIECTGPKSPELIALSIQHGVWLNVDSVAELQKAIAISQQISNRSPVNVLLRLSGFETTHSQFVKKSSRFGIPLCELDAALTILETHPEINLAGFSFHLDTVSVLERTIAIENCVDVFDTAINRGFCPSVLNIGGGYKVNYIADGEDWNRYTTALKEATLGTRTPLTWHGASFGLHAEKGVLKGSFNSYSYFDKQTGGQFLSELLQQKLQNQGGSTVASFLRDNMIELWIEPGRALIDQCGITIAKVRNTHNSSAGETLVNLAMKRQDIAFLDQEVFVDPVIVHRRQEVKGQPCAVYFAGNLCLESDLIYRHKTFLEACPEEDDAVVFINTAGYFMDFSATEAIMNPVARKVAITIGGAGMKWCLDEFYSPFEKD